MNKLVAYFLRTLAIVSSVPIPIFTAEIMWHGMDGRSGMAWWIYFWAFIISTMASVVLACLIAWGIWPHWYVATSKKKKLSESREIQPHVIKPEVLRDRTPQEMANITVIEQNRNLANFL